MQRAYICTHTLPHGHPPTYTRTRRYAQAQAGTDRHSLGQTRTAPDDWTCNVDKPKASCSSRLKRLVGKQIRLEKSEPPTLVLVLLFNVVKKADLCDCLRGINQMNECRDQNNYDYLKLSKKRKKKKNITKSCLNKRQSIGLCRARC